MPPLLWSGGGGSPTCGQQSGEGWKRRRLWELLPASLHPQISPALHHETLT